MRPTEVRRVRIPALPSSSPCSSECSRCRRYYRRWYFIYLGNLRKQWKLVRRGVVDLPLCCRRLHQYTRHRARKHASVQTAYADPLDPWRRTHTHHCRSAAMRCVCDFCRSRSVADDFPDYNGIVDIYSWCSTQSPPQVRSRCRRL